MFSFKTLTAYVASIEIAVAQLDSDFVTNHGCTNIAPGIPKKYVCQGLTDQSLAYEAIRRVHDIYNNPHLPSRSHFLFEFQVWHYSRGSKSHGFDKLHGTQWPYTLLLSIHH